MNAPDLEALAVTLYTEIHRASGPSEAAQIELQDVKGWLALRKREAESCSEPPFFLNLV